MNRESFREERLSRIKKAVTLGKPDRAHRYTPRSSKRSSAFEIITPTSLLLTQTLCVHGVHKDAIGGHPVHLVS